MASPDEDLSRSDVDEVKVLEAELRKELLAFKAASQNAPWASDGRSVGLFTGQEKRREKEEAKEVRPTHCILSLFANPALLVFNPCCFLCFSLSCPVCVCHR